MSCDRALGARAGRGEDTLALTVSLRIDRRRSAERGRHRQSPGLAHDRGVCILSSSFLGSPGPRARVCECGCTCVLPSPGRGTVRVGQTLCVCTSVERR